jgi:hypothetical protein
MVSTRDIVIIAVTTAIYTVFMGLSAVFVATPGIQLLYFPIIWWLVFPVWFGIPGVLGVLIGSFLGNFFFKGLGFLGGWEAIIMAAFAVIFWLLTPAGASELKKTRHLLIIEILGFVSCFVALGLILAGDAVLGIIPWMVAFELSMLPGFPMGIWFPTSLFTGILFLVATPVLLRAATGAIKRAGIYYGSYAERNKT